jgi:hypothetical protein
VQTLEGAGQTGEGSSDEVEVGVGAVAGVVGVVASVVRGTGVDARVVEEEGFVAAESVAARAEGETEALEARGVAGQTPRFVDEVGGVIDEEVACRIGVGGLRTDLIAEVVGRVEEVQFGVVADLAVGLRGAGKTARAAATRKEYDISNLNVSIVTTDIIRWKSCARTAAAVYRTSIGEVAYTTSVDTTWGTIIIGAKAPTSGATRGSCVDWKRLIEWAKNDR